MADPPPVASCSWRPLGGGDRRVPAAGTVGAELFHNLVSGGFNGPVYPVDPNAAAIQSVVAYPSIAEAPTPPLPLAARRR